MTLAVECNVQSKSNQTKQIYKQYWKKGKTAKQVVSEKLFWPQTKPEMELSWTTPVATGLNWS